MEATIMRPIDRRVRRRLAWTPVLALAALLAVESGHAKADSLTVTLSGSAAQDFAGSAAQNFTYSFYLNVRNTTPGPVSLNYFTIVDFAGYVPESIFAASSWSVMSVLFDPAADAALTEIGGFDDPSVHNLVFSRRPATIPRGMSGIGSLYGEVQYFHATSEVRLTNLYYFVDHPEMADDLGSNTTVGTLFSTSTPEPWNLVSLIVMALPAGLYLTLRRRRASRACLANPKG